MQVVIETERSVEIEDPVAIARGYVRMDRDGSGRAVDSDQEAVELVRLAKDDLEGIHRALRQGKSRRAVPTWSARRELWLMALCEAKHLRVRDCTGRRQHPA